VTLDERTRRFGVHQIQRPGRQGDRGRARIPTEHLREHPGKWRRGGAIGRLIQRRQRERAPEHLPQPFRLTVPTQPALDRFAGRRGDRARGICRDPRFRCRRWRHAASA
jgi:hypothetical protein